MNDPIKTLNAPEFIDLLRAVNAHIPANELITQDTLTITAGTNELAVLNLSIFINLPDWEGLAKVEREAHPLLTVEVHDHANCVWIKAEERYDCEVYA